MSTQDTCCTIVPYFQVAEGQLDAFKEGAKKMVEKTKEEPKCLHYAYTFDGSLAHAREGYTDAEGVLAHLENVGPLLEEALKISELTRLEIHGPASELEKLQEPLKGLNPQYFTLEFGFRN
ncbi:putative quinol monooxygenase [Sessilibacter sp. MAH2]